MASKLTRNVILNSRTIAGTVFTGLTWGAVHAAERNELKIGLVGCGGRGRGAIVNALNADPNTKVVALADAFEANAKAAAEGLQTQFEDRVDLKDGIFWGLDAYKEVVDRVDVVLLCEVAAFRPRSMRYAVEQGKHVFAEKPNAIDAPGVRSVVESAQIAKEKGLTLVSGLCWRYDLNVQDMMKRILDGAIGEITSARLNYLAGKLWTRPRQEGDTELMYQVRNWYNFAGCSGDFMLSQHVHTLDKGLWAMRDVPPASCFALGGRMQRVEQPEYGDIYDAAAMVFEYPNGTTLNTFCRQQDGCWSENEAYFTGTKGHAAVLRNARITDLDGKVIYQQEKVESDMYELEHRELFKSVRGEIDTINNGDYMAKATAMGIMARTACYTGKRVKWDEVWNSDETFGPSEYTWDGTPRNTPDANGRYKVAVPGAGLVYHSVKR